MPLNDFLFRRNRLQAYRKTRQEMETISNADLADMGVKRYQLGHAARVKALG
jgi:uncharacterized protein YjiS (DUF1127 family)